MARYVMFSARYYPLVGGVETYTDNLACKLVSKGHEVTIVTCHLSDDPSHEITPEGVEIYRVPASAPLGPRLPFSHKNAEARRIYKEIAAKKVDFVLVNTRFYRLSRHGLQFARDVDAPAVVIEHGSAYLTMGNRLVDLVIHVYEHMVTRWVRRYKPLFAGVSHACDRWLETFGVSTDLVIPNAVDANAFRGEASERNFREEFGIASDELVYVAIGRLCPEKGAHRLVRIASKIPEGHILWAGEGPERKGIEDAHASNIHLLGNTSRADLSALLSQADMFFLPTRSEGCCTSLLEAASWGVPAVMPRVGGTDEVMGYPAHHGALVAAEDEDAFATAMYDIARQSHDNHEMHEEIRAHVEENCSWEHAVDCLYKTFNA